MARRTSRRRSTRRKSRRRASRRSSRRRSTRRNPKYVVANKRRRRSSRKGRRRSSRMRRNRVRKNQDYMAKVVVPVLGGTVGFVAARYLGNLAAHKDWGTTDPKIAKTAAAALGIPAVFALSRRAPGGMISRNSGALVLGMGIAAAEAWLRDTKLLGGSPAAAVVAETAPAGNGNGGNGGALPGTAPLVDQPGEMTVVESGDGLSSYYAYPMNQEGQALSDDYYTAQMLGAADPADQSSVEASMNSMESKGGDVPGVSTVIPTDMALKASTMPQFASVKERFANRGDRGHAGGVFARHLFSGMMGS